MSRFPAALLLLLGILVLNACQQPATDPDQPVRDLLMGATWIPLDTGVVMIFLPNGSATLKGGDLQGTWTYKSGTFTLTHNGSGSLLAEESTGSSFVVSDSSLTINYLGSPCVFEALP